MTSFDTSAPRRADKAFFMKVASIYNDYGHSTFSLYNGVLLTSPTLLVDGDTSDVIDLSGKILRVLKLGYYTF